MNWCFWRKDKKKDIEEVILKQQVEVETEKEEKVYDEELESFLKQSQLYPYLKNGLDLVDQALTGDIAFYVGARMERKLEDCYIELWYIVKTSIELKIYTKTHDLILYIDSSVINHRFNFTLQLPLEDGTLEKVFIEKTRMYEEFENKLFQILESSDSDDIKKRRTHHLLQKDAQKHRMQNLFK